MEANVKGADNYNRLVNQIANINMEIMLFLDKFTTFQKTSNIIDNNLSTNLQNLVEHVERFLDGDPHPLDSHDQTKVDINFEREYLERVVVCNLCQIEIKDRFRDINRHIKDSFHRNMLEFNKNTNANKITNEKKVIKPNNITEEKHNQNIDQIKKRTEKQNLPKKAKAFICENFGNFINNSIKEANIIRNMPEYGKLEQSLLSSIKCDFPNAKMHLFGSRISGLGTHDSDLDIFLDIDDVFNCYQEPKDVILKKMKRVCKILLKKREWKNIFMIEDARVPIIRAYNASFKIECDIGFSNGLGTCNTRLVKYFCDLQPICQKMCIFMKKWLDLTALSKQITTYTATFMIVFYLQLQGFLPRIAELQNDVPNCLEIGPWMGNFAEKSLQELKIPLAAHDQMTLNEHLKRFFNYYAKFSYQNLIISPYLGRVIDKKSFPSLQEDMPRYFKHLDLDPTNNGLLIDKPMCLQDPFEQNHNIAKGINERLLILFRRFLLLSEQEFAHKLPRK